MPLVTIGSHIFFSAQGTFQELGKVEKTGRPHFRDAMLEGNPGFTVSGFTVSAHGWWCPSAPVRKRVQLVPITPIKLMIYGRYNYSYWGL